jgi:hypothetical protein
MAPFNFHKGSCAGRRTKRELCIRLPQEKGKTFETVLDLVFVGEGKGRGKAVGKVLFLFTVDRAIPALPLLLTPSFPPVCPLT